MLTNIGKFVEERMAAVGIETLKDLSKRSGVSKSGLCRMRHVEQVVQSKTLKRLAEVLKCDVVDLEVLLPEPKRVPRNLNLEPQFQKTQTICWRCQNAVPDPDRNRGCEWSRRLKPVKGWTAAETFVIRWDGGKQRKIVSARVIDCPKFIPDKMEV